MEATVSENGTVETEIKMESIKAGDILRISYASDGKTVSKVVRQNQFASMGTGRGGGMFFGGATVGPDGQMPEMPEGGGQFFAGGAPDGNAAYGAGEAGAAAAGGGR
jgi:hypothetical protein